MIDTLALAPAGSPTMPLPAPARIPLVLTAALLTMAAGPLDRRVVDGVEAGNAVSETTHGYAAHETNAGVVQGKPFREARGWMRYALTTFDDTDVTVACTFVRTDSLTRRYEIVVEDSLIATREFTPATPVVVEFAVPYSLTRGKTNIAVVIRARGGLTPALSQLRTIQDHNEVDHPGTDDIAQLTSPSPRPPRSPYLSGAVR